MSQRQRVVLGRITARLMSLAMLAHAARALETDLHDGKRFSTVGMVMAVVSLTLP